MGIVGSISELLIINMSIVKTLNYTNNSVPIWLIPAGYGSMILGAQHIRKIIQHNKI